VSSVRRTVEVAGPVVLAAFVLGVGLVEIADHDAYEGERAEAMLWYAGFVAPFAVARLRALPILTFAWACASAGSLLAASYFHIQAPFVLFMYSAYLAGRIPRVRDAVAALLVTYAGLAVTTTTFDGWVVGDLVFPGGFALALWTGVRVLRTRTLLAAELHEAAVRAEERRQEAEAMAVADERRRIAREMHDLVGHSVSVMVVQAGGARRILDRDPARAAEAAMRIEQTGRAALVEMRRLLGLLGEGESEALLGPQPTLEGIAALVESARDAGVPVTLRVEGEARPLPPGAEIAVYRVVQEALTNVMRHAGGAPTEIVLRWSAEALEVVVADRGPGERGAGGGESDGSGHGLVGMLERVRIYGGELSAGPSPDGGFVVSARIPLEPDPTVVAA
jgi:signal transduction histidine kinase